MRWVDRVNGNGKPFRQWQDTHKGETPPEWPSEICPGCPICGEEYASQMMMIDGTWKATMRQYVYHDPQRHQDYPVSKDRQVEASELRVPREPGE